MSVSSIVSVASFAPTLELSGVQARPAQQQPAEKKGDVSLPGDGKAQEPSGIARIAADIEKVSQALNKKLHFVVDHQTNEVIVKVIDKTTDKVVKVLPPEELQRLHRKLKETIGVLFNEKV